MTIWVMHGIVDRAEPLSFAHRTLFETESFERFLRDRPTRLVELDDAVAGRGAALTIDDSTVAAADAAELSRALGHAVTLFINGRNIALQEPYWFALLNALVDGCPHDLIFLEGEAFRLGTHLRRQWFRKVVKRKALSLGDEQARACFILELARSVGLPSLAVPAPLATLSLERLQELQALGVQIENHGWTHGNINAMSSAEVGKDISRGAEWLRESVSVVTGHYAVPFGAAMPPSQLPAELYGWWYLSDESRPPGRLGVRVVNRETLKSGSL